MNTKITTPFGYLCLKDERMEENAKAFFVGMNKEKDIEEIILKENDEKKNYRTSSPYGCGYTNRYERVLSTRNEVMKLYGGNPEREIFFVEVYQ